MLPRQHHFVEAEFARPWAQPDRCTQRENLRFSTLLAIIQFLHQHFYYSALSIP